jgi:hypothetical protein
MADEHIVGTTAFGGGGFTVWGCFSLNCKIDLYVIDGTLRGQKYRDHILRSLVVPHFDGHPLASRPILMKQYVPVEMLYFSISIRGRSHQLDSTKTTFIRLVHSLP